MITLVRGLGERRMLMGFRVFLTLARDDYTDFEFVFWGLISCKFGIEFLMDLFVSSSFDFSDIQ